MFKTANTMKASSLIIPLFISLVFSCSPDGGQNGSNSEMSANERRNEMYQEVIAIHDEVMPKMQNIIALQGKIRLQMDSLKEVDITLPIIADLKKMNDELSSADKAMMDWMHEFNTDINSKEITDQEALDYLKGQKLKIQGVKTIMNESIAKAEQFLSNNL